MSTQPVRACEFNWINLMEMGSWKFGVDRVGPTSCLARLPTSLPRWWAKECLMGSALNRIDAASSASPALERNIKQLEVCEGMVPSKLGQKYESENVTVALSYVLPMLIKCILSLAFDSTSLMRACRWPMSLNCNCRRCQPC
jgi:hypothetical protein